MRNIKFKAVSKEVGEELITIDNFCYLGDENHFFAEDLTNKHPCSVGIISVSQYTGVNDFQDVEIYENDAVEILITKDVVHKGIVVFKKGAFCLKYETDLRKENITALINYAHNCVIKKIK